MELQKSSLENSFVQLDKTKNTDVTEALNVLIKHLNKANNNKYANTDIDMSFILKSDDLGKGMNIGNCLKYLSRYIAVEGEKKYLVEDLLKATHYLLFELQRRLDDSKPNSKS